MILLMSSILRFGYKQTMRQMKDGKEKEDKGGVFRIRGRERKRRKERMEVAWASRMTGGKCTAGYSLLGV